MISAKSFLPSLLPPLVTLAAVGGCSSDDGRRGGNGVNDVRAACDIRATWAGATSDGCVECLAQIQAPACGCESEREFIEMCLPQHESLLAEPTCDGVRACANDCKDDCACVDACYAGKDACRRVSSAFDGCAADVCDTYCR
jgi:hypothetical protein